jgi:NAD(P)-dependent dehydrogenase (short-subunit alcohol dehydrogenase family)
MSNLVVITGTSGALGTAIAKRFKQSGYTVCGLDITAKDNTNIDLFIEVDLNRFVTHGQTKSEVIAKIKKWAGANTIRTIVNNAAYQYVSKSHPIDVNEILKSYNINVVAPYLLISNLAEQITKSIGCVINVGSIHTKLTKPGFIAYSTTKSALSALTRGLAIDYEDRFRINCIEPASIRTPMLVDGFKSNRDKLIELESFHPQKRIATPMEVAEMIYLINSSKLKFLHGSCIDMSGGISSRLHDPI